MPLQVMDSSKNEGKEKIKGKTKDVSKEKNILDFFKTPEKEKEVNAKQKSLLSFFVKKGSVSTPDNHESKNDNEKEKRTDNDKENLTNVASISDIKSCKIETKKQVCRKLGNKAKNTGDSSKPSTDTDKDLQEEVTINEDNSDCIVIVCEDESETENGVMPSNVKKDETDSEAKAVEVAVNLKDTNKKVNVDNKNSELHLEVDDKTEKMVVSVLIQEPVKEDNDKIKHITEENSGPKNSKRNNLKVQDMLNLLKEVQVCEKKEKKKKSKHKVDKHKSKDVYEINIGDNGKTDNTDEVKGSDRITTKDEESKADTNEKDDDTNKLVEKNKKLSDSKTKLVEKNNKLSESKTKLVEKTKKLSDGKTKLVEKTTKLSDSKTKAVEKNKKLSDSKANNCDVHIAEDSKADEIDKTDLNHHEMSYSEFLAKLSENGNEEMEIDVIDADEGTKDNDQSEHPLLEICTDVKLIKSESDRSITNFFNYTSTPGKDNISNTDTKRKKVIGNETLKTEIKSVEVSDDTKTKKNKFLQGKANVPSKTTQATLSFGSDGFKMSKQSSCLNSDKDEKVKSSKIGKLDAQCKIADENVNLDISESAFMTPVTKKSKKRKMAAKLEQSTDFDESDLTDQAESEGRRKSSRKKYKVTVFQMDEDKKTPIKIKLRRCAKSSSSGNDDLEKSVERRLKKEMTRGNAKQTKAQALLEKAKNRIHKTKIRKKGEQEMIQPINKSLDIIKKIAKNKESAEKKKRGPKKKEKTFEREPENARRISRKCKLKVSMEEVSIDNIVISSDEEDISKAKALKKKKKKRETTETVQAKEKCTPVKSGKVKSPTKKLGVKLAPMFLGGKNKKLAAESPVKPVLDPEQARQRQAFLMSGVPDELKKQTAVRQANTMMLSYPPIPTINHVQQVPEVADITDLKYLNVWKLEKVCLNLKACSQEIPIQPTCRITDVVLKLKTNEETPLQKFENPKALDEDTVDKCLNEMIASNPSYPVKEMYKLMRESKMFGEDGQNKADTEELKTDMKGILSDTEPKKKSKRSLKLKKEDGEVVAQEDKPKPTDSAHSVQRGSTLLWTDKYYPAKSSEILGNGSSLKKLKEWLLEWKQVLDREARKARKLLLKKNKGKMVASKGNTWGGDSDFDSDFDMDSDDSEDESSLCNTTLLFGPHGCGKTSSVYALGQELGFKVHEVNASSSRSGRQILSQLQEATQSHQVSSQGCHTPSKKKGFIEKPHDEASQPKSKMALSFTNLLNKPTKDKTKLKESKAADTDSKKSKKQKIDKGDKVEKNTQPKSMKNKQMAALISEDSSSQSIAPSINLSRTTLILFEEVDVAFEEDKGFITAVQTFMSTTKIPIILTSTKRSFSPSFDGRLEVIGLKRPSVSAVTSHLQTVALAEDMRTDFVKLSELVKINERDVRRSILTLQLLVMSGGTADQSHSVLREASVVPNVIKVENIVNTASALNVDKSDDDLDDFIVLKARQNKRRRILDDQDSNSGDVSTPQVSLVSTDHSNCNQNEALKCPVVYGLGLKCIIPGLLRRLKHSNVDCIKEYLQDVSTLHVEDLIEICRVFKNLTRASLFYSNLHLLLPLSLNVCDNIKQLPQAKDIANKKGKKRKRIHSDLYDSEGSDNEDVPSETTQEFDNGIKDFTDEGQIAKTEKACVIKSLSSFANFYDTMAALDVMRTCSDMKTEDRICSRGSIKSQTILPAGLGDELCKFPIVCEQDIETTHDLEASIETRAFLKFTRNIHHVKGELAKTGDVHPDKWDNFTLPVTQGMEEFQLKESSSLSTTIELQRAMNDIKDNLPYTINKNTRCIHADYIPILRQICHTESCRLTANTKRRFQHYFDTITLPLKDKTMNILSTTLS